jgi:hypothetical protein
MYLNIYLSDLKQRVGKEALPGSNQMLIFLINGDFT